MYCESKGKISQNFVAFSEYMNFTSIAAAAVHELVGAPDFFDKPFMQHWQNL